MLTPSGLAYRRGLFVNDVGHNGLGGPNGGGKTVFMALNIIAADCLVAVRNGTQIVFDIDESNHNAIAMMGGRYSTVEVGRLAPRRCRLPTRGR